MSKALMIAFAAPFPGSSSGPWPLYLRSPVHFIEWFWFQNLGAIFDMRISEETHSPANFILKPVVGRLAGPAPRRVVALAVSRRMAVPSGVQLPLAAFLVLLAVLSIAAAKRPLYTLRCCCRSASWPQQRPTRSRSGSDRSSMVRVSRCSACWVLLSGPDGSCTLNGSTLFTRYLPALTVHYPPVDARLLFGATVCTLGWILLLFPVPAKMSPCCSPGTAGIALVCGPRS